MSQIRNNELRHNLDNLGYGGQLDNFRLYTESCREERI